MAPLIHLRLHIDDPNETLDIYVERQIVKFERLMFKVLNPRVPCEDCNRSWDIVSPCSLCAATRWASGQTI